MGRHKQPYVLLKPNKRTRHYWYYRLPDDPARSPKSTGKKYKYEAEEYVRNLLKEKESPADEIPILNEYAKNFYIIGECSFLNYRIASGKPYQKVWAKSRRGQLENHILKKFGDYRLDKINAIEVFNWLFSLKNISSKYKNEITSTLKIIIEFAIDEGIVDDKPQFKFKRFSGKVTKPRETLSIEEILTLFPQEEKELLSIWQNRYDLAVFFYIMAITGMRTGEVRALRWMDVAWDEKGLIVSNGIDGDNTLSNTKNNKHKENDVPDRATPLTNRALQMLPKLKEIAEYMEPTDYIFPGKGIRRFIARKSLCKKFKKIIKASPLNIENRNITPYSLRHSFNSNMRSYLSEYVIAEIMGHSIGRMPRHYNNPTVDIIKERLVAFEPHRQILNKVLG